MFEVPDDKRVGSVVADRYQVLEPLASGGMGTVYRAERLQLGRTVAIKFLHASYAMNPDLMLSLEQEAQLMSKLEHPHCVSVIDYGIADECPFIVMEFVSGTTLADAIEDSGAMPPRRAIHITRQVLAGLAHAHDKGIVHRDIKPANIMLTHATGTGDFARILDFGLARIRNAAGSSTSFVVGTPSYMSPEQASGKSVDGRTDVYATGLVLFELLTAERAFYSDQTLQLIRMHCEQPPPRLVETAPERAFSEELEQAVAKALAKSPGERYDSPSALAEALAECPEARGEEVKAPPRAQALRRRSAAPRSNTLNPEAVAPTMAPGHQTPPPAAHRRRGLGRLALLAAAGGAALLLSGEGRVLWSWIEDLIEDRSPLAESAGAGRRGGVSVSAAEELASSGQRDEAIRTLHEVRRAGAGDGRASYLLGDLYYQKAWYAESLAAYAEAVDRDPAYRADPELIHRAIEMLGAPEARNKARALLLQRLGEEAIPALERAAASGAEDLRREARELIAQIRRRAERVRDREPR